MLDQPQGTNTPAPRRLRRRLSETIADELEAQVIGRRLRPGDRLPTEPELESEFGVSRTVVREAGRILVERGLVEIAPGRGMVVSTFDASLLARQFERLIGLQVATFEQLIELRLPLEIELTRVAAQRRNDADIEAIRQSTLAFETTVRSPSREGKQVVDQDLAFHRAIAAASHNPFFVHLVNPINAALRRTYSDSLGYNHSLELTRVEHAAIAHAVIAGDDGAAAHAARDHLERIRAESTALSTPSTDRRTGIGEETA